MLATAAPPTSKGKNHAGDELRLEFQDHGDSAAILLHGRFARPLSPADRERVFQLAQDKREIDGDFGGTGTGGQGILEDVPKDLFEPKLIHDAMGPI